MQVTKETERVSCSAALSVLAYLLVARLYGKETRESTACSGSSSGLRADVFQAHVCRHEQRWKEKLDKHRLAA